MHVEATAKAVEIVERAQGARSGSLTVTIGIDVLQRLFLLYTSNVTNFGALYGTFGSVVALLMWIYLTGSLIIFGGCLAAAQYEIRLSLSDQSESNHPD